MISNRHLKKKCYRFCANRWDSATKSPLPASEPYVTAISLWDSKEQAETHNSTTVLKTLDKFLDGPPQVRVSSVISSTSHKITAAAVVAASDDPQPAGGRVRHLPFWPNRMPG